MARTTLALWLAAAVALLGATAPVHALEYRSLSEPSVLYDAPSKQGKPLYVIARYTPVEIVIAVEGWAKVRDAEGAITWVESRALSAKRTLIATSRVEVRNQADGTAPLVFEADKGVVLELVEAGPPGWVKVRHRDGQAGFVRVNQVWGL